MASARAFLLLSATTIFLGAALLFSIEPMIGKLVLPHLGGAPAVWNTCLLFFQGMLLAGYAYAHYASRWLGVRKHALIHAALILIALVSLPIGPITAEPPADAAPVAWLLAVLLRSIGPPFFVLAATAPLVQHWLSLTEHSAGRDPYFLYAASNLGSLAGLAVYPFVLEPLLGLRAQSIGWAAVYLAFAGLMMTLALRASRRAAPERPVAADTHISTHQAVSWVAVAFVPSALLLTVTGYVTTDIAPMPLLWLLPLALYLTTFVAAFGFRTQGIARVARALQPALTLVVGVTVLSNYHRLWLLPLHLLALTVLAYIAHARLAAERPHASQLTAFYLWISVGGTLGGVFGALVAPLLLMPEIEYALLLVIALLLPSRRRAGDPPSLRRVVSGVLGLGVIGIAIGMLATPGWGVVVTGPVAIALLLWRIDHARSAVTLAVAVLLVIVGVANRQFGSENTLFRTRNFFGTLRVRRVEDSHRLVHGRIMHGAQLTDPAEQTTPTTYYHRDGPVGDIFRTIMSDAHGSDIALVGLGVGSMTCYARPGDVWRLFEINPAVVRIARDPRLFNVLERCAPGADIVVADGRRALQQRSAQHYDLIVLDAFSSDAIPAHLLTREAFALYLDRLKPHGVLAVHISNRHLDLRPVVAANAAQLGVVATMRSDEVSNPVRRTPSRWVVIARDTARISALTHVPGWSPLAIEQGFRQWSDDYTNLLSVVKALRRRS